MTLALSPPSSERPTALSRIADYPRLRYMGSKYRLAGTLDTVFSDIGGSTALDAFSGSGVVSYLLKASGFAVTSNDFLNFPAIIAQATSENSGVVLDTTTLETICGPAADDRDFIRSKFAGIFLSAEDRAFMDSAWSHIDLLSGAARSIAISALVLSAARKQPRGVFTFTGARYDDGRRDLRLSFEEHFRAAVGQYNAAVFSNGQDNHAFCGDVTELGRHPYDIVYLDPPYAPPSDDADYMKRYHFLEGLSVYWRGQTIMEHTKTKKIEKKFTPFAYKRTIEDALARTFTQFADSGAIVLSYSSNALPGKERIAEILRSVKKDVEVREIPHRYSFGTHSAVSRSSVSEYVFIGR